MSTVVDSTLTQAPVTKPQTHKRFLDMPSAARYLGYSIRHMRRIAEVDRIPIMQIGRKFFIQTRHLDTWLQTHTHGKQTQN